MSENDGKIVNVGLNPTLLYSFLAIMCFSFCIGVITSTVRLINGVSFGHDFRYFYLAVNDFWMGKDIYSVEGYLYLNYFCVLCFWMLLPEYISFSIHVGLTLIMFYFILKNVKTEQQEWWLYGNIIMVFYWSMLFNTNIWITFSLFMYQKHRDKWYSPFFLLLAFYKPTSIFAFGILFLVNIYFERRIKKEVIPAFIGVFILTGLSYLTSAGINSNVVSYDDILIFLQVPHYFWWSISILAFFEYKEFSIDNVKKFWIGFCIFEIVLCLAFLPIIAQDIETFIK